MSFCTASLKFSRWFSFRDMMDSTSGTSPHGQKLSKKRTHHFVLFLSWFSFRDTVDPISRARPHTWWESGSKITTHSFVLFCAVDSEYYATPLPEYAGFLLSWDVCSVVTEFEESDISVTLARYFLPQTIYILSCIIKLKFSVYVAE